MGWITKHLAPVLGARFRLAIEYLLIATVVVLAVNYAALWFEARAMRVKINDNAILLQKQSSAIDELLLQRVKDQKAMKGLMSGFTQLARKSENTGRKIRELEKANAQVKDYMDQPLPADLGCLLGDAAACRDQAGAPATARSSGGAVPKS